MNDFISKSGPVAAVFALATWSCWSHLTPAEQWLELQQEENLPRITASEISPQIDVAFQRDPFQIVQPKKPKTTPVAAKPRPPKALPAPRKPNVKMIVARLDLNGTFIRGAERFAIINGRAYGRRERIRQVSSSAPCRVYEILPDRVVLEIAGQLVELTYEHRRAHQAVLAPAAGGLRTPLDSSSGGRPTAIGAT